ncbi:hypothetical protein [Cupriavidus sp. TMH.W2]|uniref:hypothetical protein n=1 Tax=Cupriavidus sp. TMH.W2 TaxID=3434465 RepID=UPI003D76ED08
MKQTLKRRASEFATDLVVALIWAAVPLAASAYFSDFAQSPVASTIMVISSLALGLCLAGANHGCFETQGQAPGSQA